MAQRAYPTATHIHVEAEPRYWEDASVNGANEDDDAPTIPLREGKLWVPRIRLADGKIEGWPEGTTANVHYKVCDQGEYWLADEAGERIAKWRGYYVPDEFLCHGDDGFGDYIILTICADGVIQNWTTPEISDQDWKDA